MIVSPTVLNVLLFTLTEVRYFVYPFVHRTSIINDHLEVLPADSRVSGSTGLITHMAYRPFKDIQLFPDYEGADYVFVENIDEVPEGSHVIYSAHGVAPEVRQRSEKRNLKVLDATCPLVTKVHGEAQQTTTATRTTTKNSVKYIRRAEGKQAE